MYRRTKYKIIGLFLFILSAAGLWYFLYMHPDHAKTSPDSLGPESGMSKNNTAVLFTATGVTVTGMDIVTLPMDIFGDIALYVEEVYTADGDTVAAGEKYIRFTDDSIDRARSELEKAVQDTDLAYRSKVIANGEDSIQARYTYDMALLDAEFAPQVYQDTLTQLEMQLSRTENAYQKALMDYNIYLFAVENNTFYDDFEIAQLKKAYYDAYDLYASRQKYWEISEEELSTLSASGREDYQWILKTLTLLKEEAEESRKEYEQARQNYQSEIEQAEFKLHKLLNQLEQAEQDHTDAQLAHQKESLRAKTVYELTTARGEVAENNYNARLISLANELDQLSDARDNAAKNKAAFEQLVGDGYLYTENPGTIAMLPVEKGQTLSGGDSILAYDNTEKVSVSVSVPEEEAAKLSVGGIASVTVTDCGSFDGIIETIRPIASANDTVIVSLKGDVSAVSPDLTATVTFVSPYSEALHMASTADPVSPMYDLNLASQHSNDGTKYPEAAEVYAAYDANTSIKNDGTGTKYLEIAEIYATAGQHIKEGEPVCQFTQDSIENARKALTHAQSEALAALMEAQADYHIGVLEAGLSHNEALLDMTLAQSTYNNTIDRLNSDITAKILETEELLTDIYQIQLSLTDDTYRQQQAEITKAYNNASRQLEQARESFVTNQAEAVKAFQAAKESYETFISQFEVSDRQIKEKAARVYALQDEIFQSQQMIEKELIAAEQTRNSSQTAGEIAYVRYTDSVKKFEDVLNTAQAELDQATRRLEDFDQFIGDGTIYASQNGKVVEIGYRKGDLLTDTQKLVFYVPDATMTDPETAR